MIRTIRQPLALLFAGLLAACSDATGATRQRVDLDFGIQRLQTEPAFVVSDGGGEVKIRGYFQAPCSAYEADADAIASQGVLTVRVTASYTGAPCLDVVASIGYEANVRDVPSGTYRLRVVHAVVGSSQPGQVVLDTSVAVE
jgi:hypothetical protein